MDITIHASYLPHTDPDASLAFYRDLLGFEVRGDVGYRDALDHGRTRRPARHLHRAAPPPADPGITDEERRTIAEMMAKGTYASINLATADLDGTFERVQASAPRSSRSRPSSRTASATAPSATPRATWSGSSSCGEPGSPSHQEPRPEEEPNR